MPQRSPATWTLSAFSLLVLSLPALAVDDEAAFVEALRQRGEHELALEYLDGAPGRGLTTDAFRRRLSYERLITRLDQVRTIRTAARREAALADAAVSLERFTEESGDNQLAAQGQSRLAGALAAIARQQIAAAEPIEDDGAPGLASAREALVEARRRYAAAARLYEAELEKYKSASAGSPDAGSPDGEQRLLLRDRLSQARLLGARALQQRARAYKKGSPRSEELNSQAAEELATLYERYSRWLVGLYAHLYEGRCYLRLGKNKLAAGCFESLVDQRADDPSFRRLITLAHASLVETRIAEGRLELAIDAGRAWYERLPPGERDGTEALGLAYQLASASEALADGDRQPERRRLLGEARQWLRSVSRAPNEFRDQARRRLNRVNDALGASGAVLSNFAEAYQAVRDAIGALAVSKQAVRLAERNNPEVVEELQDDIGDYRRQAIAAINAALALVEDGTPIAQINEVRSNQAFLLWESGDYLRSAVVGDFLVTQYPGDPAAEQAASLALASLQRLYQQARRAGEDGRFEAARLERLTESINRNLPGARAAAGAAGVLVGIALNEGRTADAQRFLELAPEADRPALELQLAGSVWEQAVRQAAEASGGASGLDPAAARRRKAEAAEMLAASVDQSRGVRPVSAAMATAVLYLAQARLDAGDPAAALRLLEDEAIGPLTLLANQSPAASRGGFAIEAHKLALRCFVAADPPQTDEAIATMTRLEQAVRAGGGDPAEWRPKLTRVYLSLGLQLQRQIDGLVERGQREQARQVGAAFAVFLEKLARQATDAGWATRQWIGQTYLQLADRLGDDNSERARGYRGQARDVFLAMIEQAEADPAYAPKPTSLLAVRLQLGRALSRLGEHERAFETLCGVLRQRASSLEVQKEAAAALQAWGAASDPGKLRQAVRGARPDPKTRKNLVWGWNRLSRIARQAARKRPEYEDLFFEAWVNIVACKVLGAERAAGAERGQQLASAKRSLAGVVRQYGDLGGPERREQFDQLARRVQRLEGVEPVGVQAFER